MRSLEADTKGLVRHGWAAATALACLGVVGVGPAGAAEYIITITGEDGATFGGTCLSMTAQQPASHRTSGTVPLTMTLNGDLVSCAIQKKTGTGHLRIVIRRVGGEVVADSSQEQPFGVVLAAGR